MTYLDWTKQLREIKWYSPVFNLKVKDTDSVQDSYQEQEF